MNRQLMHISVSNTNLMMVVFILADNSTSLKLGYVIMAKEGAMFAPKS